MKNYKFYAVVDDQGLVSVRNENYETLKAIFSDLSCAKKMVEANKNIPLKIQIIEIVKAP